MTGEMQLLGFKAMVEAIKDPGVALTTLGVTKPCKEA